MKFKDITSIKGPVKCIGDISGLFYESLFDMHINHWDTSKVKYMSYLFAGSPFKHPINN